MKTEKVTTPGYCWKKMPEGHLLRVMAAFTPQWEMRHQETPTLLIPSSALLYSVTGIRQRNRQSASPLGCPFYTTPGPHPAVLASPRVGLHTPLSFFFLFLKDEGATNIFPARARSWHGGGGWGAVRWGTSHFSSPRLANFPRPLSSRGPLKS